MRPAAVALLLLLLSMLPYTSGISISESITNVKGWVVLT